jgi:hypothetical protein
MARGTRPPCPLPERLFVWSVLAFLAVAVVLLLADPDTLLGGGGRGEMSAITHLLTLGGLLGGYFPLQAGLWRRLYGREPALPLVTWAVLACHVSGVGLVAWGFFHGSPLIAHLGGHYLVPTGIVLAFVQGVVTTATRPRGRPRHLAAHLPGLGLLVTMGLGALLVMDAYTGQYGIYTAQTILVHMTSGAFLFFLPLMLLHQSMEENGAPSEESPIAATAFMLPPAGLGALGVLAVALAAMEGGYRAAQPVGLALLGAVALWIGLPAFGPSRRASLKAVRRSVWGALGLLLLYAAIRTWRGMDPAEAYGLMRASVTLFLFVVALPEILNRLTAGFVPTGRKPAPAPAPAGLETRAQALHYAVLLLGAGILLAAQIAASPNLVRAGALLWALCLGWQAGWFAGITGRRGGATP